MERELPTVNIEGTDFFVDVIKNELKEKANPQNRMSIKNMLYVGDGYRFQYDMTINNFLPFEALGRLSNHSKEIKIPNLVALDPIGMAKKYNLTIEEIREKTDFELTIKPGSPLDLRWNKKILPTLDIAGHTFYVDLVMDKLRPKDDFKSKGIDLSEIKEYYDRYYQAYIIPYNPKTHEFQEVGIRTITELPKEIIVIKFPHHRDLDHVGWNIKYGFGPEHLIKKDTLRLHFKARTLPWKETNIPENIKLNLEEQKLAQKEKIEAKNSSDIFPEQKKGRKM
jgi:hypothetical protein